MAKGGYVEAKAGSAAAPEAPPTTAVREAAADKENRGELESINIRMAENGLTVSCSYEPKKRGLNAVCPSPSSYVFEDVDSALAHIKKELAGHAEAGKKEK